MRKFSGITLLFMLILAVSLPTFAEEQTAFTIAPVSPQFQEWLNSRNIKKLKNNSSDSSVQTERKFPTGCIPSPIDRSNLWKNPPRPKINLYKAATLPAYYDLREQNRVTSVKNQNPHGTCWAFASLGSLESTYKKSYSSENPDLSEMLIAYFAYGDTRSGKSFEYNDTAKDTLSQGGNADIATTLLSRLGTVNETTLPYPSGNSIYTKPSKYPENYESSGIYLKDAYLLGSLESDEMKKVAKKLIMDYGGVYVGYYMNDGPVKTNGYWAYFDNSKKEHGHAVTVVGWDDNFSRNNFPSSNRPSSNGAWLVRNSWGTGWHDSGYFWMSYEQYTFELALFIAGKTEEKLKQYGYDDLGRTGSISAFWGANIFKAESDETLKHVGFYTVDNNESYTIYVYDLGTSKPSSPVNGTLLGSVDGYKSYAGYHTEDFNIKLTKGHYFSVVMKADTLQATEQGYAEAVVNSEESYCSSDGESWTDMGKTYSSNACLKAFTVDGTPVPVLDVKIDAEHFPDNVFRNYILEYYDTNGDEILSNEEAASVKKLAISNKGITSLKGIEYFTVLTHLSCFGNQLTALDMSKNTVLTYLSCSDNQLTALDVSKNTALTYLNCSGNQLTALDVSSNTALTELRCYGNPLTALDVSGCTALQFLYCNNNQLTALDVSKNIALTSLYCYSNQLTVLDISKNTALRLLYCNDNQLTSLDVSKSTALRTLDCSNNQLTALDVSGCTALQFLHCNNNQLTALDVSKNTSLIILHCYGNQLTALDVSKNTALRTLDCSNNQLTALDVSKNTALTELRCFSNQLTALDVSKSTALRTLNCSNNQLTALDVSGCTALQQLYCNNNQLTTLDVSNCHKTIYVNCDSSVTVIREKNHLVISTQTITDAIKGKSYTFELSGKGGTAPYTWTISSGSLPNGLSLAESTGEITGEPTNAGTFTFTVQVADNNGKTAVKEFSMKVTQTTITASIPATIVRGKSYTWTLKASGGTSAYTWSKSAGTLPNGMSINASTGKITGKPTKAGTFKFTLKVTDKNNVAATKAFTVKVTQTTITLTVPTTIVRGKSYTWTPKASGGTSAYTWSKSAGTLPNGMSINASTGKITGKPTKAGTFKFTIKAIDKNKVAATKAFTVTVTQTTLTLTVPATIVRGKSYTWTPSVTGGTSAYTWSKSAGTLPNGMSINASTGKITGKPTKAGTFKFTIKAIDKNKVAATKAFTVKVTQTAVTATIPATIVRGKSYTWTPKASGGTSAYTWTISKGSLPTGMNINASTGKITGKPSKAGTFNFTVKVTDKNKVAATKAFTVKVTQTTITLTVPTTIVRGKSYTLTPKASGGTSAYTWSKSAGTLPNGMGINASTGKITGKPSKAGTFKFTIKATDKNKIAATKAFTVKVTQTTVSATIPATIKRGTSYTWTPKATGGTSAYTWTISKGSLPTGMKINAGTGKITGKPTKTGTFSFTIKAKDKNSITGTKAFTVKVTESTSATAKTVSSKTTAQFETGTSNTQSLKASIPVTLQTGTLTAQGSGTITLAATLNVESDDVLEAYDGKDSDLVKVKANTELTFIIGEWGVDVSELTVYVDDKPVEGLTVEEGRFTLTPEMVQDDFKVSVKAQSDGVELESEEVYIISE